MESPVGAHLVGSVPLRSAEEVFHTVAGALGDRPRRIPDGETGPRSDWIVWQYPVLSSRPEFEVCPPGDHPLPLPAPVAAVRRRQPRHDPLRGPRLRPGGDRLLPALRPRSSATA